ncbi:hypothetical protein [Prosthecodimorpha staleyi]|uniref:Uncharacterized protein n=1 Tax=Prosthecodimorpha staleyi TaxID=2840188 RepID=A0A947DC06_9HYPH|nr:hypothetical protein [Prosthecodimorpha staleyi]MBT9293092.1 hypothetical protein [Prosthecodimorpha staleyi]
MLAPEALDRTHVGLLPGLDLDAVRALLIDRHGCTPEQASEAERLYRMFLELRRRHPDERLVPPAAADRMWHVHILMTGKYRQDCKALFGQYLDHDPMARPTADDIALSRRRYREAFGVDLAEAFSDCT